jgi:hypothetical protein
LNEAASSLWSPRAGVPEFVERRKKLERDYENNGKNIAVIDVEPAGA